MSQIETDHEFKTRMSAEGPEIYVPGKTDEQIAAEQERKAAPKPVTLHLSENDLTGIMQALPQTFDLVSDFARACEYLGGSGLADDVASDLARVLRLFARACQAAEAQELESLFKLETKLRDAVAEKGA